MLVCGNSIDYIQHHSYQFICDDTWNVLNMHQPPLTKRGKTKTNKQLNCQDVEIKLSIPFNGPLHIQSYIVICMMMSWHVNTLHITGPLWGESTSQQWSPSQRASNAELVCFLCCRPGKAVKQTVKLPAIWDNFDFL